MTTKTKNIIIISSIVTIGISAYFTINYFITKKPKLTDEEKKLLEEMARGSKRGGDTTNNNNGSNTNGGNNSNNQSPSSILDDANNIFQALAGWTTDKEELKIVEIIKKYNRSSINNLREVFATRFKRFNSLDVWLDDDLSESNLDKLKNIL